MWTTSIEAPDTHLSWPLKLTPELQAQGIVAEGEWDQLMAALMRPLPVTFRITGSRACVACNARS